MISLGSPGEGVDRYLSWMNLVIGPKDPYGRYSEDTIEYSSEAIHSLNEWKGLYGENNVLHWKNGGSVSYNPGYQLWTPSPTLDHPDEGTLTVFHKGSPGVFQERAIAGIGAHGTVGMWQTGSFSRSLRAVVDDGSNPYGYFTIWEAVVNPYNDPTLLVQLHRYEVKNLKAGFGDQMIVDYDKYTYSIGTRKIYFDNDWWVKRPTLDEIIRISGQTGGVGVATAYTGGTAYMYQLAAGAVYSPSSITAKLDALVAEMALGNDFPIPGMHYGDLAMTAAESVNVIGINTIAFIRDLRDPLDLVPKLRNLASLKGLADNYLTINYGILPTISDIQSIISGMRRVIPYLDKNGFSTYTARHDDSLVQADTTYTLEQHIKLAIGDEDNVFEGLVESLDNIGILPTFENIWDLLPYSFVIDWLVDVGGFLERVDAQSRLLRLNIRYVTSSRKETVVTKVSPTPTFPLTGSVEVVHYHRWVSDQCPVPPLSLSTTFQDFDHWLESTALILQRGRR